MLIECEICGAQWDVDALAVNNINNICPICNSVGSLFLHKPVGKVWTKEDFVR